MVQLPPKPVWIATLRITFLVWVVLRSILALYHGSLTILLPVSLFIMMGAAVTAVVDATVARERLFLGNLGLGRRVVVGIALLGSGALEVVSAVVVRALDLGG